MSTSVRPHRQQPTRLPHPWDSPGKNTGVGCHFLLQCIKVKSKSEVAQSCPTLSDPVDCSPPGSSVHGIFQARVLEWGAIPVQCNIVSRLSYPNCLLMHLPFIKSYFPPMLWLTLTQKYLSQNFCRVNLLQWFHISYRQNANSSHDIRGSL